jgi:hypothetical protein
LVALVHFGGGGGERRLPSQLSADDQENVENLRVVVRLDHDQRKAASVRELFGMVHLDLSLIGQMERERTKGAGPKQIFEGFDRHERSGPPE